VRRKGEGPDTTQKLKNKTKVTGGGGETSRLHILERHHHEERCRNLGGAGLYLREGGFWNALGGDGGHESIPPFL